MHSDVFVSLLVSLILLDEVEIVPSDNDGSLHLGGDNHSSEDSSTDGDITSEWTLLVNVGSFNGLLWGLESESNLLVVPWDLVGLLGQQGLGVLEYSVLLLECIFFLDVCHFE